MSEDELVDGQYPPERYQPVSWEERFLSLYAQTGNVTASARACGITKHPVYKRRTAEPEFARRMDEARELAIEALEAEARRRALDGSDVLLIFLLKALKPEMYRESIRIDVRKEAERIAADLGMTADEVIAEAERILSESAAA